MKTPRLHFAELRVSFASMAGRPSKYRPKLGREIVDRLANGESLNSICKSEHMPHERTVRRWVLWDVDPDFTANFREAREIQAHRWFEQIVDLSDESKQATTMHEVQSYRLRMDARRWAAARILPTEYGDKLEHHHSGGMVHVFVPANNRLIEDAGGPMLIDGTAERVESDATDS
jgi:hypothetical protein